MSSSDAARASGEGFGWSAEFTRPRRVIEAPLLESPESDELPDDSQVRIRATVSADGMECVFEVNRTLLENYSWVFQHPERTYDSDLARRLFAVEGVGTVTVDGSRVIIQRAYDSWLEWAELAPEVGKAIRAHLASGKPALPAELLDQIPDEATLLATLREVVEREVNPGVGAHGGMVTVDRVRGNTAYITMGGGCQGCASAAFTLREGIQNAFRRAAPMLGAIYDHTDHAAGTNPFFSSPG